MHAFILHEIVFCLRITMRYQIPRELHGDCPIAFGSLPFPVEKIYPAVETIRLSPSRGLGFSLESILVWGLVLDLLAGLCYSSLAAMVGFPP